MNLKALLTSWLLILAGCLPAPITAQLPPIGAVTELEITRVKPAKWPLNPLKKLAMKRRGETPQPRIGPTIKLVIHGRITPEIPRNGK